MTTIDPYDDDLASPGIDLGILAHDKRERLEHEAKVTPDAARLEATAHGLLKAILGPYGNYDPTRAPAQVGLILDTFAEIAAGEREA